MSRNLPARPSLEHLKKQAKAVLQGLHARDLEAARRFRAATATPVPEAPQLADAQFAIAREYGFASWPRLKAHVESAGGVEPIDELVAAVKAVDVAGVRRLLDHYPTLRKRLDDPLPGFDFGGTALLCAAGNRSKEMVETLLAAGANINQKSHWWAGPFGLLDHDCDPASLEYLLARGATMDAYSAARHNRMETLRALVAADPAAVHTRGGDGQTPLHVAASVEVAKFLLDHGADIDARDLDHESTPAMYLVKDRPDVARYLVSRGAWADILMAAALGDLALVRGFLDADPAAIRTSMTDAAFPMRDPRAGGSIYIWTIGKNRTPHQLAWEHGHEEVYAELMARSPDDLRLAIAGEVGDEAALGALLGERPDLVRTLSPEAKAMLAHAAQDEKLAAVRRMLAAGWPVDARGQHGATALHWAAWHGNVELAREILRYHPPLDAKDADFGGTPLGWAEHGSEHSGHNRGNWPATIDLLRSAGATA